ncbi:phosphatidylglycerophosphatase A [Humitalea rosea]|uniref:Phosphatidylglycerophosphatase A n=1 Tax=Humitalea rosea TaxID=990373 RepID=A0A2W7J3K2_9PROT|nr:phosphatidylglycerophosphatase A [Humitalea rosea]PZW45595.1 phosphatidylglycerophosphatase A [Humitalea rosea]
MRSIEDRIAALGGVGHLRPAPGSWGSAVVLPIAWAGPGACLGLAVVLLIAGLWALRDRRDDPGWVVVDEGAGQALALAALPALGGLALLPWTLGAFALFRAFDILKPGPIGWVDRQTGAWGVMGDDILAGVFAGAAIILARGVL